MFISYDPSSVNRHFDRSGEIFAKLPKRFLNFAAPEMTEINFRGIVPTKAWRKKI